MNLWAVRKENSSRTARFFFGKTTGMPIASVAKEGDVSIALAWSLRSKLPSLKIGMDADF